MEPSRNALAFIMPIGAFEISTARGFETSAMPPQDGLRLNYLDHAEQVRPEPYEQRPVAAPQSKTRWCSPQSNIKLMLDEQVFSLKTTPRLEHVGDKYS
jgi:hypothetical protein